jgi:TatA/E family protein of Tat protein translocase
MLNIGPQELIVVLVIALLVVGPSRLPELGRSIGKALREFRKVQDDVKDTFRFDLNQDPAAARAPRPGPSRPPAADRPATKGEVHADPAEPDVSVPPTTGDVPAADVPAVDVPAVEPPGDGAAPEPEPSA